MSYLKESLRIPEEIKIEVAEAFARVKKNRLSPSMKDLKMMFDVFNKYIDPYPDDIHCPDCRRAIFDFYDKVAIKEWKKRNLI